ncbi:Metallo-hydrolase/oxidoreductase [Cystobasidium minutum MCA 4210]|uniref:Metallo-hydrolase/oxidoreductase n=1 Tax=Cystobasidium minutum MCA 4210 TaxID=1397322 RepID=UPI0034CD494F|eukprot:jgi/Rhomi1/211370/estExt_Genemark1.C_4_t30044
MVVTNQSARQGGSFKNPWPSAKVSKWRIPSRFPISRLKHTPESITDVKTVRPTFPTTPKPQKTIFSPTSTSYRKRKRKEAPVPDRIRATWLGHASVLVQFRSAPDPDAANNINVLFDPVFSRRASPYSWFGPRRRLALPCTANALPAMHAVCISHNHYDHLDVDTVDELVKHDTAGTTMFFVPLGCSKILLKAGVPASRITEKDWWEDETLCFGPGRSLRITCTPAQHSSSRKLLDWDKSLWCGWLVEHEQDEIAAAYSTPPESDTALDKKQTQDQKVRHVSVSSVFFAGDTGYRATSFGPVCPAFREIGEKHGPIDLAFIPIWRGCCLKWLSKIGLRLQPGAFNRAHHCTPMDAVDLHRDIQAKTSVAIHHSTFVSEDESRWSIELLKKACDGSFGRSVQFQRVAGGVKKNKGKKNRKTGRFVVLDVGGSIDI